MKTSHEDSMEKVIKNTGNLDTINISATNKSNESAEQINRPARRQKMEWLDWVWGGAPPSGRGKVREW